VKTDQDSFSPCTGDIVITISHQTLGESGAGTIVVIRIRAIIVEIEIEHACITTIVPVATTSKQRAKTILSQYFYFKIWTSPTFTSFRSGRFSFHRPRNLLPPRASHRAVPTLGYVKLRLILLILDW